MLGKGQEAGGSGGRPGRIHCLFLKLRAVDTGIASGSGGWYVRQPLVTTASEGSILSDATRTKVGKRGRPASSNSWKRSDSGLEVSARGWAHIE
jgi:hypothetical protein